MDKYSFTFYNWCVTHENHFKYKKLISKILFELYTNQIEIDNFCRVPAQDFDDEGSYISILNNAIGNITLFKSIVIHNNILTFDELIEFIENNKIDLFKQGGVYFDNTLQVLKISERKGIKNEKKAIKHIKKYLKSKNIDFKIRQTPLNSALDVIEGIDIIITINDMDWYVQVKPLKYYFVKNDIYEIISSGKIKKYNNIHYYIFVDEKEILFFSNNNLEVIDGIIYVPKINLKN